MYYETSDEVAPGSGITLRDYFAALSIGPVMRLDPSVDWDAVAHDAYLMADAMLKARESQEEAK